MLDLRNRIVQTLEVKPVLKMMLATKLADVLDLTEEQFTKLIRQTESDPLFKKLFSPKEGMSQIIKYQKFPRTDISRRFTEYKEEISAGSVPVDVELLLENKQKIVDTIRLIGIDKFKQYFLYNEKNLSSEKTAEECGLTVPDVDQVNHLINEISIHNEFYHPSALNTVPGKRYTKIAGIEKDKSGNFQIGYYTLSELRGKYIIDYDLLTKLKKEGEFTDQETKRLNNMMLTIELINTRKSNLYRIILHLIEIQNQYLQSEDSNTLRTYSQIQAAEDLSITPSIICRAIKDKSIELPWGEEKPLKDLFYKQKNKNKLFVKKILENKESLRLTDEGIKKILKDRYGINISRRSVNLYRQEMKVLR